jgi:flagellar basal body-associated protein FliL
MADDAGIAEEDDVVTGGGNSPLIKYAVAGCVLLALLVGVFAAGGYFLNSGDSSSNNSADNVDPDALEFEDMTRAEVVPLGSFTVNLRASGSAGRLLQMEISVEANPPASTLVADREAQLRDAILMAASDFSYLELEGLDGRLRLRDEIYRRVNEILDPEGEIKRVYFTSFVVQ